MSKYNEMSLDELKKIKEDREKKGLIQDFSDADDAKVKATQEAYDEKIKTEAIEAYLEKNPPTPKIKNDAEGTKPGDDAGNKYKQYFDGYMKRNGAEKILSYEEATQGKYFQYESSDAGCGADPSSWRVEDVFVKSVWHTYSQEAQLGKICVSGLDISKGQGLAVQIRSIAAFGDPTAVSACTCLDCATTTFSTTEITLQQLGMKTEICELDVFDIGDVYKDELIKVMAEQWAVYFDTEIYDALEEAAAGNILDLDAVLDCDGSLGTDGCCAVEAARNMWALVVDMDADMREAHYKPDYLIMSPSIAAYFKYKDALDIPYQMRSSITVADGILTQLGSLKVIEYESANPCADTADEVFIIMIDSRRAIGQAFGKRPTMEQDRNIDCNSTTVAFWAYWGVKVLDVNAIGHIKSP